MKATVFAVVFSLFAFPLLIHAEPGHTDPVVTSAVSQASNKINLNKADCDTLTQSFKGVGKKRAEAIIAYREANGGFKSLEDLALVKGIGKAFVQRNLQQLQETYTVN